MSKIRIYFRQYQPYLDGDLTQPQILQPSPDNDNTAVYVPGTVAKPDWEEMTEWTEGLEDLTFSWSALTSDYTDGDASSKVGANAYGSNYDKGLSSNLVFYGKAFQYIFDYLMLEAYQTLNMVEVRLIDTSCNRSYRIFELKADNVEYRPFDEPCIARMVLREQDTVWHVFQKTPIEDNWQNWFNADPDNNPSTKKHAPVAYVVERRPKFLMAAEVALVYVCGMLSLGALTAFSDGKRWIKKLFGVMYFSPSCLIRDYIFNICAKYGYTFDTLFDDVPTNKYKDVALFYPVENSYHSFDTYDSPSNLFQWNNRTALPFTKFLDMLKKPFNAEWYVTPGKKLVFKHKSYFANKPPLYDFTAPGADKFYKLVYSFNGKKKPAYGMYQYQIDPGDACSNDLRDRYNAVVDFDGPENNPLFEGNVTRQFDFASTSFYNDGSAEAYLPAAVKLGRIIALSAVGAGMIELFLASNVITAAITAGLLGIGYSFTNEWITDWALSIKPELNGVVRMADKVCNQMRLLDLKLPDPDDFLNGERVKVKSIVAPPRNPRYNDTIQSYYEAHPPLDADDIVWGVNGIRQIWNYRMYVDELYLDNLYPNFLELDNPLYSMDSNQDFSIQIDLCCDWQDRLGTFDGQDAQIGAVLVLETRGNRKIKGRITNIQVDEKNGAINIRGIVMNGQVPRGGEASGGGDGCDSFIVGITGWVPGDSSVFIVQFVDCAGELRVRRFNMSEGCDNVICAIEGTIELYDPTQYPPNDGKTLTITPGGQCVPNLTVVNASTCGAIITQFDWATAIPCVGPLCDLLIWFDHITPGQVFTSTHGAEIGALFIRILFPPELQDCRQHVCVFVNDVLVSEGDVMGESNFQSEEQINVTACDRVLILLIPADESCDNFICQTLIVFPLRQHEDEEGAGTGEISGHISTFEYMDCYGVTRRKINGIGGSSAYICGFPSSVRIIPGDFEGNVNRVMITEGISDGCNNQSLSVENNTACDRVIAKLYSDYVVGGVDGFDFNQSVAPDSGYEDYHGYLAGKIFVTVLGECTDTEYLCLYVDGTLIQTIEVNGAGEYGFDAIELYPSMFVEIQLNEDGCFS